MARKAKVKTRPRGKRAARRSPPRKGVQKPPARKKALRKPSKPAPDPLDAFIAAAAATLGLPVEKGWLPTIKANLRVTLQHADAVIAFDLPDDAQPAPVFKA